MSHIKSPTDTIDGTWDIDSSHSYVGFVIRHMMISKVRGSFTGFRGQIVTNSDIASSRVEASIDVRSLNTGDPKRDTHVTSADFFDAESYPTMSFESTNVRLAGNHTMVDGNLTIRGVTHGVTLMLDEPLFAANGTDGARAGFSASTTIDRRDFGISYSGTLPGGGLALGERVQIILEIQARLKED
jgi:polyisoprenoid-binding protein YceI